MAAPLAWCALLPHSTGGGRPPAPHEYGRDMTEGRRVPGARLQCAASEYSGAMHCKPASVSRRSVSCNQPLGKRGPVEFARELRQPPLCRGRETHDSMKGSVPSEVAMLGSTSSAV